MAARLLLSLLATALLTGVVSLCAQPSSFTYQGRLLNGGAPATGVYDLAFKLFDQREGGGQQGPAGATNNIAISNGLFTAQLDFGAAVFNGAPRWLEISIRPAGTTNGLALLAPRQALTSTPYAIRAGNGSVLTGRINQLPSSPGTFFGAASGFSDATVTESSVTTLSPQQDGAASNFSVRLNFAPGAGRSLIFTLRVNGADTPVSCTVSGSDTAANSGAANVPIPAGAELAIRVEAVGFMSGGTALYGWCFK